MNVSLLFRIPSWLLVVVSVVLLGCDRGSPNALKDASSRERSNSRSLESAWVAVKTRVWSETKLTGEPLSPTQIKEAHGSLDAAGSQVEGSTETQETTPLGKPATVLLAGRIDAGDSPAFSPRESVFILSELPEEGHGDDPDHSDNCPFCKRRLKNAPKAIVQIQDQYGELLSVSADVLLGLKQGDIVLVSGIARYDETLKTVFVQANKISFKN